MHTSSSVETKPSIPQVGDFVGQPVPGYEGPNNWGIWKVMVVFEREGATWMRCQLVEPATGQELESCIRPATH